MGDQRSTRPPPPPERIDIIRLALKKPSRLPREEPIESDDERFARQLAGLEGRLLKRFAELQDVDDDRPSQVHVEVAPAPVEKKHWLVTAGTILAGCLAGGGALVAGIAGLYGQLHTVPVDNSKDIAACKAFQIKASEQFAAQYAYDMGFRHQVRGAFDAQGAHFPDAQGEPTTNPDGTPVKPIELLPRPLKIDPHKISTTPLIQPAAPLALPPKF
jgi:hypothetical protein